MLQFIDCRGMWLRAVRPLLARMPLRPLWRKYSTDSDGINEEENEREHSVDAVGEFVNERRLARVAVPPDCGEVIGLPVSRRPLFPGFYKTIGVSDARVAAQLTAALKRGRPFVGLFLSRMENAPDRIRSLSEVHSVGVFAQLVSVIAEEKGATAIVLPHRRIRALELLDNEQVCKLRVENVPEPRANARDPLLRAIAQEIFAVLSDIAKLNPFFREHIAHHSVDAALFEDPCRLADFVAVLSSGEGEELQRVLEANSAEERMRLALVLLKKELVGAQLQRAIGKEVDDKVSAKQREYLLHEQLKTIKRELGLETDTKEKLLSELRVKAAPMPPTVRKTFDEEIAKLLMLEAASAEFGVTRNYLEWLVSIPWQHVPPPPVDLSVAAKILDEDHFGLEDVKARVLELVAVAKLRNAVSGKIVLLSGPAGTGKTSVARSIARALGREYVRMSVGGLSDVAEIKGHRRTYIGAMPGKIVQALRKCQTRCPLVLIDEIDKLGRGQGDPGAALLEMLDPEQNAAFMDHYLDVPLDLSQVLFVCTANVTDTIPAPLLDRMEVISLSGYVLQEKMAIAQKHLIPQALTETGMQGKAVITEDALRTLISGYCRENGVRNLKKHIEKILRKCALKSVRDGTEFFEVSSKNLAEMVGQPQFTDDRMYFETPVGVAMGLAWTAMGGQIMYIETQLERSGQKSFVRTGQLGKVMDESASIALTYASAFVAQIDPQNTFFSTNHVHLHCPEGATPKDGPSAGVAMATSLVSLAINQPLNKSIAMTGELSLTGKVLRIGGLKEKIIAAKSAQVVEVIFPRANLHDWEELPSYLKENLVPRPVETFNEVYTICFNKTVQ